MSNFSALGLQPELLSAVENLGFETPTAIQAQAIPAILKEGRDLVALARTGTGKTAAFGLPLVQLVDTEKPVTQALILSPTRELANQISGDLTGFARFKRGLRIEAVYGGTSILNQIRALKRGVHIVAATPGRALDLIRRGDLKLDNIRYVVLDEADEMLNMGFLPDIDSILAETPTERQTMLFSATMPSAIAKLARRYMKDPEEIQTSERNSGSEHITHEYYQVQARDRFEALTRIIALAGDFYGIVFCRTRRNTEDVARRLSRQGFPSAALHGDMSQGQRDEVMAQFRDQQVTILVATDVAARGLDVNELTHVVNYELPEDSEAYIHRSGRTGRAGNQGISAALVHSRETHKLRQLERMSGQPFTRRQVPTGGEVCQGLLLKHLDEVVATQVEPGQLQQFMPAVYEKLAGLDREQLIQQFIARDFAKLLDAYAQAPDLNVNGRPSNRREEASQSRPNPRAARSERGGSSSPSFVRFQLDLGSRDNLHPGRVLSIVNEQVQNRNMRIGKIKVLKDATLFEVEAGFAPQVVQAFTDASVDGQAISLTEAPQGSHPADREEFKGGKKVKKKHRKGPRPRK
jgi:ATP-dependent RNA helicase DeaD